MKRVGLVIAMQVEAEHLISEIKNIRKVNHAGKVFYEGTISGTQVVLGICRVGKVNAAHLTSIMCCKYSPSLIISVGIAGGLGVLDKLDVLVADGALQHDVDLTAFGYEKGVLPGAESRVYKTDIACNQKLIKSIKNARTGLVATGDQFINSNGKAKEIASLFGVLACDMESAAVAQVATLEKIPFCIVRVISDDAGDQAEKEENIAMKACQKINHILLSGVLED